MDIPFQLKFFKKLELYQYLKELDRSNSPEWKNERAILSWAANPNKHRDLGSTIDNHYISRNSEEMGVNFSYEGGDPNNLIPADNRLRSLVTRGYAEWNNESRTEALFTQEGFLMGEVINELRKRGEWRYWVTYNTVRIMFWMGALLIVTEAIKSLWSIIKWFFRI